MESFPLSLFYYLLHLCFVYARAVVRVHTYIKYYISSAILMKFNNTNTSKYVICGFESFKSIKLICVNTSSISFNDNSKKINSLLLSKFAKFFYSII